MIFLQQYFPLNVQHQPREKAKIKHLFHFYFSSRQYEYSFLPNKENTRAVYS